MNMDRKAVGGGGGGSIPLYKLYKYVPGMVFEPFSSENGYSF